MHKLHDMIEKIEDALYSQMANGIECIDTDEFGKVADIFKDLMDAKKNCYKAQYYESVTEAMEDEGQEYERKGYRQYKMPKYRPDFEMSEDDYNDYRDMDRKHGRMYYTENASMGTPNMMRDHKSGRNWQSRRSYMESKEMHNSGSEVDNTMNRKELDKWVDDIAEDVKELLPTMTSEERMSIKQKMTNLINAI